MATIELEDDSTFDRSYEIGSQEATDCITAINKMNEQLDDNKIKIIHLNTYRIHSNMDYPLENRYITLANGNIGLEVSASHYVGHCIFKNSESEVEFIIKPRFAGNFCYLMQYATDIFIPPFKSKSQLGKEGNLWIIALLWKAALNNAIRYGQIPKAYIKVSENLKNFKGRLAVTKHIHTNMIDASHFFCTHRILSFDNIINRTIKESYNILLRNGMSSLINEIDSFIRKLDILKVNDVEIEPSQINDIVYNRMNYYYKPVMELSKIILVHQQYKSNISGKAKGFSYFIDIAELWEMYLLKLLRKFLPPIYKVSSPNMGCGDYLLENGFREIRPDIIITKEDKPIMIIDAKYKRYNNLGRSSKEGVSREDLYQMNTYLYHYGNQDAKIFGIFTCPVSNKENSLHTYKNNRNHQIGVVNLDLYDAGDSIEQIKQAESEYIGRILNILDSNN